MSKSDTANGWIVTEDPLEVSPKSDLKEHLSGETCWCRPFIDDGILVHNSSDEREKYERGERKPS